MPENNCFDGGVVTTTKTTVRTETETTVEIREKTDEDGVQMVAQSCPMPIKLVVKNFTKEKFPTDEIINGYWVPIRKQYRLVHNVDIVMCPIPCLIPEKDDAGNVLKDADGREIQTEGTMFHFLWSKTYNDYGLDTDEQFVYQRLTRREKVKGDIRGFQNDPTKVRMTYVAREIYDDFERSERKLQERHRSKTVIVRKMRIPSDETITELMEAAVNEFIDAVRGYLKGFEFNENERPEMISFKYSV